MGGYPVIRTGAGLMLKVMYEPEANVPEKTIGFATNLSFTVIQGQKSIFTVDSPFPQEIAQGAGASQVKGSVTLYMLKRSDPIRAGLVSPTGLFTGGGANQALSRYFHWRFYDRTTQELAWAINYVKISSFTINVQAKQVVTVNCQFEGMFYEVGTR